MKSKNPKVSYDPNLIWACSVDLREEQTKLEELKLDRDVNPKNILPPSTQPDLVNPEQTKN